MVNETTATMYGTAKDLYLGWMDASINANERFARLARVWTDETLAAQQDAAGVLRRSFDEAQDVLNQDGGTPSPFTLISRAGDLARTTYFLWTEAGLKAQERITRVYQTAFEEMRGAQTDLTARAEDSIGALNRRSR